jgi:hypothetical protein
MHVIRTTHLVSKNTKRFLVVAASALTSVHFYNNEKSWNQGRVPKIPKPAVQPPTLPPKTRHSLKRLVTVVKRLIQVAASLFPVLVSYLLKSTPVGETREQWLKRLVQTLANLGD